MDLMNGFCRPHNAPKSLKLVFMTFSGCHSMKLEQHLKPVKMKTQLFVTGIS